MKRILPKKKKKILKHVSRKLRKSMIRKLINAGKLQRFSGKFNGNEAITAPKSLSFASNYEETVDFFKNIKNFGKMLAPDKGNQLRRGSFRIDLSHVTDLSVRSAVVFSAEIDRLRRLLGANLSYSGRARVAEDVTSILAELGCFTLIDIEHPDGRVNHSKSRKTLIKLISGRRVDEQKFEEFDVALSNVFREYHTLPSVYEGMGEALLNVRHHAYLEKVPLKYPCPGHRWWATACFDAENQELRIFVYDQGVGIPATLPYSGFIERATSFLKGKASHDDATLLKGALEHSRSRTGKAGRGKGFRDIMACIDTYGTGRLRVISGKAEVTYRGHDDIVVSRHRSHIGGTLIEWTLPTNLFRSSHGEN